MDLTARLEPRSCPLCGPEAPKRVKYPPRFISGDLNPECFTAREFPEGLHFRIVECERCGILSSDPALPTDLLGALYSETRVTYEALEAQIFDSYKPLLERAARGLTSRRIFLEIGGGSGFMLRFGVEAGFSEQIEVEPSTDAAERFHVASKPSRFISAGFAPGMLAPQSVSLACAFQVLDHVADPSTFLRGILEVLEPGGRILCALHNTKAVTARLFGERSPIITLQHTHLFNPQNLSRLLEKVGFEGIEAFPFASHYSLGYWLQGLPLAARWKSPLTNALTKTGLAKRRLRLYAGNFAVIAARPRTAT